MKIIEVLSTLCKDAFNFLPPGLILSVTSAFIADGAFLSVYQSEFLGTLLMIACTFSAGKWIGVDSTSVAWASHFFGVIAADFLGGGPHVDPAVTLSMWALGKCSYTDAFVRTSAQMGGGLVAFPLFFALSKALGLAEFGGPEFHMDEAEDHPVEAFLSETVATFLLLILIYVVNWELNFGSYHYIIKQSLTAIGIRALIEFFPITGPAMNPMLATAWAVFGVGTKYVYPDDIEHYFVYWVGPYIAAILASVAYGIYSGNPVFGAKLPLGPIKKQAPEKAPDTKEADKETKKDK